MLIDFHCHTKAVKSGEKTNRDIKSAKDFCDCVSSANVKMVAITNHNHFDIEQYKKFRDAAVEYGILVLPGVELDVREDNGDNGHVVMFCSDKDVDKFSSELLKTLGEKEPDEFHMSIKEFIGFANRMDNSIIMAHYCKSNSLGLKSINRIREDITNNFRLFYEPSNYKTLGIMVNNEMRAIKGSDNKGWQDYSSHDFANIKLDIESYEMLFRFIKKDKTVIDTLINRIRYDEVLISVSNQKKEKIKIYEDINVIFGEKASGKSKNLDEILEEYRRRGFNVVSYEPKANSRRLEEKLKVDDGEIDFSSMGIDLCKTEFEELRKWSNKPVTKITDYVDWAKTNTINANRQKMKILECTEISMNACGDLTGFCEDYKKIKTVQRNLGEIAIEAYLNKAQAKELKNIILLLKKNILEKYNKVFSDSVGIGLANKMITSLKEIIDKNTEAKSIPSTTGFTSYAKNILKARRNASIILSNMGRKYSPQKEYVGELGDLKRLYIQTTMRTYYDGAKAADGFLEITKKKEIYRKLSKIITEDLFLNTEEVMESYSEYLEDKEYTMRDFAAIRKDFVLKDGTEYVPSTGEGTMIILNEVLDTEADVYVLDEPENSLSNGYVNDTILRKINELSKRRKTIVIVTHSANIAIRTLPYQTILKVYDGKYNTYIGNLYTGKLINVNSGKEKDWREESIRILEGGKEAFSERRDIYEER